MKKYEAPFARDLSTFLLKGQVSPQGGCYSGAYPYYRCVNGPEFITSCTIGNVADTSYCNTGAVHLENFCRFGADATTSCKSGSHQN
jgi:hypothetical protein